MPATRNPTPSPGSNTVADRVLLLQSFSLTTVQHQGSAVPTKSVLTVSVLTIDSSAGDHQVSLVRGSSGIEVMRTAKPSGGAMPPSYASRKDRRGIVRVAA
jgi:hypothetical protein